MSRLGWFGVLTTLVYIGIFCWLFGAQISEIRTLEPNELGDFFAGVFGPVALFWVVLGFFQQGVELRHSVETLKLQAEELKNSVEQQRELVKASRDQIELDRETILHQRELYLRENNPVFVFYKNDSNVNPFERSFRLDIINKGEIASDVSVDFMSTAFSPNEFYFPSIARGERKTIEMSFFGGGVDSARCKIVVRCSRRDGTSFEESYSVIKSGWGIEVVKMDPVES